MATSAGIRNVDPFSDSERLGADRYAGSFSRIAGGVSKNSGSGTGSTQRGDERLAVLPVRPIR
jgi:hypothetical protein